VIRPRDFLSIARLPWLAAITVLLAARLLSPAGFMPGWKGGGIALQHCDGVAPPPMAHHGHGRHDQPPPAHHQPCPYAVAAAHAGIAPAQAPAPERLLVAAEAPPAVPDPIAQPRQRLEQPRSRGPPIGA
jgi:hypothetical protein